jgi:hypothetical protein
MKKETMLDYLDKQLEVKVSEFDTAIDWDTRNHTIEVIVRLFAENKEGEAIDDAEGVLSEEEVIEFEDGLIFYNSQKTKQKPDPQEYLAVIPFDGKKGIQQAVIDGALTYLNEVLINGQDELLDFLTDPEKETFELVWETERFDKAVEQAEAAKNVYLPYPSY